MSNSLKAFAILIAVIVSQSAQAGDETIYTWTDQEALTNYGDIPPDDEMQNNAVKVISMQKGVTQKLEFPTRNVNDPNPSSNTAKLPTMPNSGAPTAATSNGNGSTSTATTAPKIVGQSNPPAADKNTPANDDAKANAPTMIASGKLDPMKEAVEEKKIQDQEAKLEEDAKTARRVAIDKRKQEMQTLAERVRNGAASRQEIATLMTYRQTASFAEARSAMARPKTAAPRKVVLTD